MIPQSTSPSNPREHQSTVFSFRLPVSLRTCWITAQLKSATVFSLIVDGSALAAAGFSAGCGRSGG